MDGNGTVGRGESIPRLAIKTLEGSPVRGDLSRKMLLRGQHALLVELQARRGTITPAHRHGHDSYLYVVSGRMRSAMGADVHTLGPGDAVLHPAGVEHAVEALEDTVWVEVKTPAEEPW